MALEPIGDIGVAALTEQVGSETLTWATAAEWDANVSETGVVHEDFGDRDATRIELGFPSTDPVNSGLAYYYPLDEASGPATDATGNGPNGSLSGSTSLGNSGTLGTTCIDFPGGGGDTLDFPDDPVWDITGDITVVHAIYWRGGNDSSSWQGLTSKGGNSSPWAIAYVDGYYVQFQVDGTRYDTGYDLRNTQNTWALHAYQLDSGSIRHQVNGGNEHDTTNSAEAINNTTSDEFVLGARKSGGDEVNALVDDFFVFDYAISDTRLTDLYDAWSTGTLTTATKTVSSSGQPDLQNLVYSLNGESITLDVIGSPGTASEETVTQALDGSSSYTLTWADSHTDFRVRAELTTSDPTVSPTVSQIELVT
ncbi:hypothetical protein M201_gp59 [Haloarcula californiae tailed virus 2]|uniref:LamG domain-containing protein n=1 Tax=Haloarcula californiae tailed virus 2 TaxID=1273747 RepID=R4TNM0_9CAUD|nr:hypothetical protein M201_gp59 [Haloarcula californiae tailed virus 2]AGM11828.1 hypothetical protein HCTV2_59 [Haloarcula californiae tailed virus 2]